MSSHTDEEIRLAMKRVGLKESAEWGSHIDEHDERLMAELNKPAIHPACYVVYDVDMVATATVSTAKEMADYNGVTNVRVLILAETVTQMLIDIFGGCDTSSLQLWEVLRDMKAEIADYTRDGPDCIDGGM